MSDNTTSDAATGDLSDRPWANIEPGQLIAKGHAAGDLLEAWRWKVLEEAEGLLVIEAQLPDHVLNPAGQLFGGFTPTYVDLVSLYTVNARGEDERSAGLKNDPSEPKDWLTTLNMRCDYFEPIVGPTFTMRGELTNQRGLTSLVSTKFFQGEVMAAHAITTIRRIPS